MSITFKFYTDANLTTPLNGNLIASQNYDGTTDPIVFTLYFGSPAAGKIAYNKTNQGVATLVAEVIDSAPGSGHAATEVKLAATLGDLATATPGTALTLGTQVLSGIANKKPIYIQVDDATGVIGNAVELSVQVRNVRELVA